ncbi:hypothetical protein GE061_016529 [Apolygus lucorum]|uniref:Elongin-C n=1 Tax=Apolygus lucorum TaxID=248454 RepID=A0A8S9XHL9_APOLU|nr:hypothetical protein GE061_016529 [Apolygus lucorum]
MNFSSSHVLKTIVDKNNVRAPNQCRCEEYKLLLRCSDLVDPAHSWIKDMVVPCTQHKGPCNCDLILQIPYGYFFPVDPKLELGNTIGPESTYVRIISNDGFRFVIKRKLMRNCLLIDSWFKNENQTGPHQEAEIFIKKYPSICVHYLCRFLMYKYDYETGTSLPGKEFTVPDRLVFQMLEMANDFLL